MSLLSAPASASAAAWSAPGRVMARTVSAAVAEAAGNAADHGVTAYISVVDRADGDVLAETPNADHPVQSESVMKLFIAAYYLVAHGGYRSTPVALRARLAYMLKYSDDVTASSLFRAAIIPEIAQRYGLTATTHSPGRVGWWCSAQISAADMTTFLARAGADPLVGPWLLAIMERTAEYGTDGFDQDFGLNALAGSNGPNGSKQGWGNDTPVGPKLTAVHSVGFTDQYFVAILRLSTGSTSVARATSTYAARTIAGAMTTPLPDGIFVRYQGLAYRMVGGAPIRVGSWSAFGGVQPYVVLEPKMWAELAQYPADGSILRAAGLTFLDRRRARSDRLLGRRGRGAALHRDRSVGHHACGYRLRLGSPQAPCVLNTLLGIYMPADAGIGVPVDSRWVPIADPLDLSVMMKASTVATAL